VAVNVDLWDDFTDRDNTHDRHIGQKWERNFCALAADHQKSFTAHQIGRDQSAQWYKRHPNGIHPLLLPDATIWSAPGEHHEIKHKRATHPGRAYRCYGLEKYRLDALVMFRHETQQPVMYTVHDWELAGATSSSAPMLNRIDHWLTADVLDLAEYVKDEHLGTVPFPTWVNGQMRNRPGYFWPTTCWVSLRWWWGV